MKLNKFYVALSTLVVWVVLGLLVVAPWFFAVLQPQMAAVLDFFVLIVPFFLLSGYVISQRRLAPDFVTIPVLLVIGALYAITLANLYNIGRNVFGWF